MIHKNLDKFGVTKDFHVIDLAQLFLQNDFLPVEEQKAAILHFYVFVAVQEIGTGGFHREIPQIAVL